MKGIFVYVMEFMLSIDKMQYISTLNVPKALNLRAEHFERFQAFHTVRIILYIGCSGPVIDCNILILFRHSTTGTMPLTTQILRTVTNGVNL